MLIPKAFVMCNPQPSNERWLFALECSDELARFVEAMPCVQIVLDLNGNTRHVHLDMRYDYEEAWLWIYEQLEAETGEVKLDEVWGVE